MKKVAIFDLDGTLSDSIMSIKYCADRALSTCGFGPFKKEDYFYFVGDGAPVLIERCLKASGDEKLEHYDTVWAAYKELFAEHCMYEVKPYDGIVEALNALKNKGVKLAVLSNKPHAETINVVESLFGKGFFDVIHGHKPDVPKKPSPEGVYSILKQLSLNAEDALYIGDTNTDMDTGKSAGAFTIGVLWGFRKRDELEAHHADAIIENPTNILDYVD